MSLSSLPEKYAENDKGENTRSLLDKHKIA